MRATAPAALAPSLIALALALALAFVGGCREDEGAEAGVGGDREGCGDPGTHSVPIGEYSCVCEADYEWCDEALDDFECCPLGAADTQGEDAGEPEQPCGEAQLEEIACVEDPLAPGPAAARVWACNGERWVEAPGYDAYVCMTEGFNFAYGCLPGEPDPNFMCGYGPGNSCLPEDFGGVCVDGDIIDDCFWGRRTVDRCSRLCAELEVFGPGFVSGSCVASELEGEPAAACSCRLP